MVIEKGVSISRREFQGPLRFVFKRYLDMRKEKWPRNQMRKDGPSRHITRGVTDMVAWCTSIIPEFV